MPLALCCMSHSPLLELCELEPALAAEVDTALCAARDFALAYDPDVVVLFTPDHYNGFFYKLMPPFCIGYEASGVGDYGTASGPLDVPRDIAEGCAQSALDAGIDLAISLSMQVDHGAIQPLEKLFGGITAKPVVPIFINSVATPLGPIARARLLGKAIGEFLNTRNERMLIVGSGGLSHDPPVPTLATATGEAAQRIIAGHAMTSEQRAGRTERVIAAAAEFASGGTNLAPLNPDWDRTFLRLHESGDLATVDSWSNRWITEQAGGSAHEVRTWVAAYAALATSGSYSTRYQYYRPIPELIAGFAVTTAVPSAASTDGIASNAECTHAGDR
jgi:2,3-dihydroxyphenylpropionate 1,2-dioxygenase